MCLITFAYNAHPEYELILAGNRDEFYARPTREAQFWTDEGHPEILAGKDLKAGGTWLGINKDGRWGALTNYRDFSIQKDDPPSRGELVLNYLRSDMLGEPFLQQLQPQALNYNGFNLLLGDREGIYHMLNQQQTINKVEPGIHGLSNASLDTPWMKLQKANKGLKELLETDNITKKALFDLLLDEEKAPDEDLPQTGLDHDLEKAVSSIFIKTKDYGSRCSTLLLIDKKGHISFTERRYIAGTTQVADEQHFTFSP